MYRKNLLIMIAAVMLLGLVGGLPSVISGADVTERFTQDSWAGGSSPDPVSNSTWTRYLSKDNNVFSGALAYPTTAEFPLTDTTGLHFNNGAKLNLDIYPTPADNSEASYLKVQTGTSDPFGTQLSEWTSLREMPRMDGFSTFARAGNYIYALWTMGDFGRYDIITKKWEMLADLSYPIMVNGVQQTDANGKPLYQPVSAGPGAGLAYPGSGEYLYAIAGGGSNLFFRYHVPNLTDHPLFPEGFWEAMPDISVSGTKYFVGMHSCLAAVNVTLDNITYNMVYCAPGTTGRASDFLGYNLNQGTTGIWERIGSIYSNHTPYFSRLVYPGDGPYIYLSRYTGGVGVNNFYAYHISKGNWTFFKPEDCPTNIYSLSYPGTGDYLYSTYSYYNVSGYDPYRYKFRDSDPNHQPPSGTPVGVNTWERLPKVPINQAYGLFYDPGAGTEIEYLHVGRFGTPALKFNTSTLQWNIDPHSLTDQQTASFMVSDGTPYIYTSRGSSTGDFRRYNTLTRIWEARNDCNVFWYGGASMAFVGTPGEGKGYALRGGGDTAFWSYDVKKDTWTGISGGDKPAPAPASITTGAAIAAAKGQLYVFRGGGYTDFWKYDPATNAWSSSVIQWSGLNDFTKTGGSSSDTKTYKVMINTEGVSVPDTFNWKDDVGSGWDGTNISITGSTQQLGTSGVSIKFASTTGHTIGNWWSFTGNYASASQTIRYALNDLTIGGTYDGTTPTKQYIVKIAGQGITTADAFIWSDDGGDSWHDAVLIDGTAQPLSCGITVKFSSTLLHVTGTNWTFAGTDT